VPAYLISGTPDVKNDVFWEGPTCRTSHNLHLQTKQSNNSVTTTFLDRLTLNIKVLLTSEMPETTHWKVVSLSRMSVSSKKPL